MLGWRGRSWVYPLVGIGVVIGLMAAPGWPFAIGRWPLGGAFGVFTWIGWAVATALAVSLALLGMSLRGRGGVSIARIYWAAGGFAALALAAFAAAARADLIEQHPLLALLAVGVAGSLIRRMVLAASPDAEAGSPEEDPGWSRSSIASDPNDATDTMGRDDDTEVPEPPRWARWLATGSAVMLVLIVILGTAVKWLGPGLGLVLTLDHPAPIFWRESAFFEYESLRRQGKDATAFLRPPGEGSEIALQRGVLVPGTKLAVKGWIEGGAEVRVEHDPGGRLVGEWGYVRIGDVAE